jgi:hypothetical protein
MKRCLILIYVVLVLGSITGCAYLKPKEPEPPPLPQIETQVKPPYVLRAEDFKEFPWLELGEARKDEPGPNAKTYEVKPNDTLDSIAESQMGDRALAKGLSDYNKLTSDVTPGDKLVIPNPIIGVSSHLLIKSKGQREFGPPEAFDTELKKGDEFKLQFEPNVDGYLYVLRQRDKGVDFLYPEKAKPTRRGRQDQPASDDSGKVKAHQILEIPSGKKGLVWDLKNRGDAVFVFLSMRRIDDLEKLKSKKTITEGEIQAVMHGVREEDIVSKPPYKVLRISDPDQKLGFKLDLKG